MGVNLVKYLPKILRTQFWEEFFEVWGEELDNFIEERIVPKYDFWNVENLTDDTQLLNVSKSFGNIPDRSLDTSIDYLKWDIDSILYKIKYKSTHKSYNFIFRTLNIAGNYYVSFWDGIKLNRVYKDLDNIDTHDYYKPFYLNNVIDIAPYVNANVQLDINNSLDNGWYLDEQYIKKFTKHLFIEYILEKILVDNKDDGVKLIDKVYLDYLFKAVENNRRVVVVPHVGVQLTGIMDNSGKFDENILSEYNVSPILHSVTNLFSNSKMETTTDWQVSSTATINSVTTKNYVLPFRYNQESTLQLIIKEGETTGHIYQPVTLTSNASYATQFMVYVPSTNQGTVQLKVWYDDGNTWQEIVSQDITTMDSWHKVSTLFTANDTYTNHIIGLHIANGAKDDTFYVCRGQLESITNIAGGIASYWTEIDRPKNAPEYDKTIPTEIIFDFSLLSLFKYNYGTDKYIFNWVNNTDNTYSLSLRYQTVSRKFVLQLNQGGNSFYIQSDLFDDGTQEFNIYQKLKFIIYVNLNNLTQSRFIIQLENNIILEYTTWSSSPSYDSNYPFEHLYIGTYNGGDGDTNVALIDFKSNFVIYNDTLTETINSNTDIESILNTKTIYQIYKFWLYENYDYNLFSIPDLKLNCTIIPTNYANDDYPVKMAIGTGYYDFKHRFWTTFGYTYPNDLVNKISVIDLYDFDYDTTTQYMFYKTFFQNNIIKNEIIATGDGSTINFSGIFKFPEIKKQSIQIIYTEFPNTYIVTDDGEGNLNGDRASGTINYNTGEFTLITEKDIDITNEVVATGSQTSIDYYTSFLEEGLQPGTVTLDYWITTGSTVHYRTTDDGSGNFPAINGISSGTVDYATGHIVVTFTDATDPNYDIKVDYTYNDETPPDNNTNIIANYESLQDLEIREAGLYNENDELIAYMTFPKIKLGDRKYHISPQFFIKTSTF